MVAKFRKISRLAAAATLIAISTLGIGAQAASGDTTDNLCDFAVFIGVRGTGAPEGANSAHSNRLWRAGGMGGVIAPLKNKVAAKEYPVWSASLNYPANTNYNASVAQGANTLATELNYLATACGSYVPAVVLAGHSQGADVIATALGWGNWPQGIQLTQKAKAMISAVVLEGDPGFFPGDPWNAPGSPNGMGIFPRNTVVKDTLKTFRYWGWAQGSSNTSASWNSKIRSYCFSGDFFCQNDPTDSGFNIHNSYGNVTQVAKAASWIDYMLIDLN